jgi:hypothetical protein
MRFHRLEEWVGDQLDRVPWRWVLGPPLAAGLLAKGVEWLVWHGY